MKSIAKQTAASESAAKTETTDQQNHQPKSELKECITLWRKESKGGTGYLSGNVLMDGEKVRCVGFFNNKKKNPNEPDVRIYFENEEGHAEREACCTLWSHVSKNEKRYLSGYTNEKEKVVGFYGSDSAKSGRPYIRIYYNN